MSKRAGAEDVQTIPKLNQSILLALKLVVYFALFATIMFLTEYLTGRSSPYFAMLIWLLIVVPNRGKLSEFLQELIDRSFYRTLFRLKQKTVEFNSDLNAIFDYDELIERIFRYLDERFLPGHYQLYLFNGTAFEQVGSNPSVPTAIEEHNIAFGGTASNQAMTNIPVDFYSLADIWGTYPAYRPMVQQAMKAGYFQYFLPLRGVKYTAGFILFDQSIEQSLNMPEVREFLVQVFRKAADIVYNARINEEVKRRSLQSELFIEIIRDITSTLNLEGVLEHILDSAYLLAHYDAAVIFVVDPDGHQLRHSAARGYEEGSLEQLSMKRDQGITGQVITSGKSEVIPDVSAHPHYLPIRSETRSQLTVPIISRGNPRGAMVLECNTAGAFSALHLDLIEFLAGLAAIAIRNASLYEDSLAKQHLENELLIAGRIQQNLLPLRVPTLRDLRIDVINIPSRIVGGDLYDVFKIGKHRQAFAIGDVAGKGPAAAMLMAVAIAGFKTLFRDIDPVATTIARLNNFMVDATATGFYLTFFFGIYDNRSRTFTYCNGGHNAPLILRSDGTIEKMDIGGIVLGYLANQSYSQAVVSLASGDYLCFYTDGVTEIMDENDQEFGEQRLSELLRANNGKKPGEIRREIVSVIKAFSHGSDFQDDLTLIIARITGD